MKSFALPHAAGTSWKNSRDVSSIALLWATSAFACRRPATRAIDTDAPVASHSSGAAVAAVSAYTSAAQVTQDLRAVCELLHNVDVAQAFPGAEAYLCSPTLPACETRSSEDACHQSAACVYDIGFQRLPAGLCSRLFAAAALRDRCEARARAGHRRVGRIRRLGDVACGYRGRIDRAIRKRVRSRRHLMRSPHPCGPC